MSVKQYVLFLLLSGSLTTAEANPVATTINPESNVKNTLAKGNSVAVPLPPRKPGNGSTLFGAGATVEYLFNPSPNYPIVHVPGPPGLLERHKSAGATFSINYLGVGRKDLWKERCYAFPKAAKAALEAAAVIWGNSVRSSVPITIQACWANLGSSLTLGYAGTPMVVANFPYTPRLNVWYSKPLANSLSGRQLWGKYPDIAMTFNGWYDWYLGIDGNTPSNQVDLVSVVLQEIAHGLNFYGSMDYSAGMGTWGFAGYPGLPNIFDTFLATGSGVRLTNPSAYVNSSYALGGVMTSNDVWFIGNQAVTANAGLPVKMFAPATWMPGSSLSHLDYTTFVNTPNALMVYAIGKGESRHDPGPVSVGILRDLGWSAATVGAGVTLSVVKSGTGSGVVRSLPPGLDCGSSCVGNFPLNSRVVLSAVAAPGSKFSGWSKACTGKKQCVVSMKKARLVKAGFVLMR